MLVASITNPQEIRPHSADLVELRLDSFSIDRRPPFPCIFTLRKKEQGGVSDMPEAERLLQIEKFLELQPDYCDLEADTDPKFIERIAHRFPKVKLIGSYHNFKETPQDLDALLQSMRNPYFAIYKIALTAQSTADMLRLMIFARIAPVPLAAISMGEYGKPSRVLGPIMGNPLDYAGVEEEPCRYSLKTLHEVFHYRNLNRETLIYALIGDPIEQSPGHLFHNPRFKHNAVYVKMRLNRGEVPEFLELIKQLPFGGLSVTMPLKEAIFTHPTNTITFRDQKLIPANTDGRGALNAIEKHLKVDSKRIAILGAGGTARAIALEAKQRGAIVSIYNRTLERAEQLATECSASGYPLHQLRPYDILINTIPVPISILPLPNTTVMDVIYTPKETPLLAAAKKLGCHCIYGEEMFVEQALLQQREWLCP